MRETSTRREWIASATPVAGLFQYNAGASCRDFSALQPTAQAVVDEAVRKAELPGIVAALSRPNCPRFVVRSGWLDIEKRQPVRENTIFDIRSITKPVTALAALILVDRKCLDLDWPVSDALPEARSSAWAHKVTLRHLLTHTSGLGQQRPKGFDDLTERRDKRLGDVAQAILDMPLAGNTGIWQYSSPGYCLAGRMIEVAAARSFAEFVTDTVLRPLQMSDTSFLPPAHARNRIASLYQWKEGALALWPRQLPKRKWVYDSPDFGLYSTAIDLTRLLTAVSSREFPLFGNNLRTQMLTPITTTGVPGLGQGLGWMIAQTDAPRGPLGIRTGCFGHNGSGGSMAWADPATRTAAVLLTQVRHEKDQK